MVENINEIFTGERFVPGVDDDEITIEHYQRYESILHIVKDKVVVDAACGEGYGSSILGSVAKSVLGMDISPEAVERATKAYGNETVKYQIGDISNLQLEDNSVEVFVSFETIEHVSQELQGKFISEVRRVLKDDGLFIISSPNKAIYSDLFNYNNEFHIHEMYKDEFEGLLKKHFPYISMYNQYLEVASIIDNNNIIASKAQYKKNVQSYNSDGKYFIAVASKKPIEEKVIQSVYLKHDVTYRNNIKRIFELQKEVDDRNLHLSNLDSEIKAKDSRIVELQDEHEEDVIQIKKLDEEIKNLKNQLEVQKNEYNEKLEISEYNLKKANKAIYDKDVHINNLDNIIRDKDKQLTDKDVHISNIEPIYLRWRKIMSNPLVKVIRLPFRVVRKIKRIIVESKKINKLRVPEGKNPKVSIVIPAYNQFDYTYECIKSIIEHTKDVNYEVILADDVSTDETINIKKYIKGINVIRNTENLKFLLNCNNAAKYARGKFILFLNNDTKVTEGWLSSLVELIESDDTIGMVGSKLIYPDGRLQEAGGIIWKDASAWNYGNGQNPDNPEFNYVRDVDYISGAAIMLSKKLWDKIGGFDETFVPAYCEDSDLAFQVREQGYRVVYQPLSVVVHFEGVSNGTDTSTGLKHYQIVNNEKLKEKWAHRLKEHYNNGEYVLKAKDRCFGDQKTIVFIDHYVPQFDKDAGSRTVFQYVKMFIKKGYCVKFVGDNFFKHEPYTTVLNKMGVEVLHGSWYKEHIFEWFQDNNDCIDYVFMNRPHISEKYIDFFNEKMKAKVIYYGHDLHFLRINREYELTGDDEKRLEAANWKSKELGLMHKANVVYYPSSIEADLIKEIDSNINVKALVPYVYDEFNDSKRNSSFNKGILFVGGFSHTPNVDAVTWFVKEVYTKIKDKENIPFYIAGSNPPEEILAYDGNGIDVKGFVSDEELEALYKNCKLVVVPLRYGAGVKGKVVEAIYNGVPIVTTGVGAEGIPDAEDILVIKDEPEEFANAVVELYRDNAKLDEISAKMQRYIKENNSIDAAWKVVGADFS